MALDLTDFFTVIGKYIKTTDTFAGVISTIASRQAEIEAVLEAEDLTRLYGETPAKFLGMQGNASSWIEAIIGLSNGVISDRDFVREQIPTQANDPTGILLSLIEYMNDNTAHVNPSVVTIGSVTDNISAATAGDMLVNKTLDGIQSPVVNAPACREYLGLDSQMSVPSDIIYAQCMSANADGQEVWKLYSTAPFTGPYQAQAEAAGEGPSILTANSQQGGIAVQGGDFETFTTTNVPDGWTMTGTVTTDYLKNNTAAFVFRGSSSLQINTSGTALKQQIFGLTKEKLYLLSLQVARPSGDPGGSALDIVLSVESADGGTVYDTSTTTVAKPASGSDVFVPVRLYFWIPESVDVNNVYIKILANNYSMTPTAVYLDEVLVSAPVFFNGVNFSILRGVTHFQKGDRFQVTITNDEAGVIQSYFRKANRVQLPTDGSPSIADSLAT